MKERTYGIILGILNIVLLIVCGVLFLGKDKNAPEILLSGADFVYAAEIREEVLFEGVTAMDQEDGELTDSVVIEKIVTDVEKETATITYGVADSAGNVGKATCTVAMEIPEEVVMPQDGSETEEVITEAGEEDGSEESSTEEDLAAEEESDEVVSQEENADSEEEAESEEDVESEDEESQEEDFEAEREALPTAGEAANRAQTVISRPNPGRPSMAFRAQEVTVKAGQTPAWVQLIEGLYDDKDNYETLLKSLQVKGDYEKDKAGTYNVTVTVTDADGNESNAYPLKIVVEEWQ